MNIQKLDQNILKRLICLLLFAVFCCIPVSKLIFTIVFFYDLLVSWNLYLFEKAGKICFVIKCWFLLKCMKIWSRVFHHHFLLILLFLYFLSTVPIVTVYRTAMLTDKMSKYSNYLLNFIANVKIIKKCKKWKCTS